MIAFASGSSMGVNTKLNLRNHLLLLKYDRSGRSSGVAIITYEKPAEAARAKKEYEGKLAKGSCSPVCRDHGLGVAFRSADFGVQDNQWKSPSTLLHLDVCGLQVCLACQLLPC